MCEPDISLGFSVWIQAICGRVSGDLTSVSSVICPKCQNTMRTVDRQGIHIDQCDGCRGIFLDRGELESILSAEQRYSAAAAPPPPYQGGGAGYAAPPPTARYGDSPRGYRDSPRGYAGGHGYQDSPRGYGGHGGHHGKRRRKSFLEELFD